MRKQILYFGNAWFTENRTSSHHVARWLAQSHDVHYFECPGLRAPTGSARDVKKVFRQLWRAVRKPATCDGVTVRPLLQIPLHRFAVVRRLNQFLMRFIVRRVIKRYGSGAAPITWFTIPHAGSLAGQFGEAASVYYCIDDYSAVPGVNADAVRAMDTDLTRRASVCFVASETLLEEKRRLNPRTFHSPHGVDVEHFGRARSYGVPPADIAAASRPIVGFFGLIEDYIDLELLDYLASQRPEWTFLLIGRVAVPPERVPQRANLLFVGPRPYETLPDYGRQFAAGIIPYRLTDFTFHANPLKLREYLAMGLPVVATLTPQTARFEHVATVVTTREEWLRALDIAVTSRDSAAAAAVRMSVVAECSWDTRIRQAWNRVEETIAAGGGTRPAPDREPFPVERSQRARAAQG